MSKLPKRKKKVHEKKIAGDLSTKYSVIELPTEYHPSAPHNNRAYCAKKRKNDFLLHPMGI